MVQRKKKIRNRLNLTFGRRFICCCFLNIIPSRVCSEPWRGLLLTGLAASDGFEGAKPFSDQSFVFYSIVISPGLETATIKSVLSGFTVRVSATVVPLNLTRITHAPTCSMLNTYLIGFTLTRSGPVDARNIFVTRNLQVKNPSFSLVSLPSTRTHVNDCLWSTYPNNPLLRGGISHFPMHSVPHYRIGWSYIKSIRRWKPRFGDRTWRFMHSWTVVVGIDNKVMYMATRSATS